LKTITVHLSRDRSGQTKFDSSNSNGPAAAQADCQIFYFHNTYSISQKNTEWQLTGDFASLGFRRLLLGICSLCRYNHQTQHKVLFD